MNPLIHIASLVVLTRPERFAVVRAELDTLPGLEIPLSDPCGKLVVVLETSDESAILAVIQQINAIDGVLAVNLVYHHCEDAAALAQEAHHADYPS